MINSNTLKKIFFILLGIFGEISSLVFLFIVKYRIHNLQLRDLDLFYFGNFINLLLNGLIVLLLIFNIFRLKKIRVIDFQVYFNTLFFSILLLLIAMILLSKDFYALSMLKTNEYEFEKVFSVIICLTFFVIKTFSLNYLLLKFIYVKRAVLPKNLILIALYFGLINLVAFIKIYAISKTGEEYKIKKDERFDAMVVLGAAVWKGNLPSPIYEGRLNKAYELYQKKFSSKIILTGGKAPFELSESDVGRNYLVSKGIHPENIELEKKTTSTIEQLHFIKRELIEKKEFKEILVISDGFHLPRVIEIGKFLSIDFKVARSNLRIETINNIWYRIRESVLLSIFWLFAV